MRTDLFKAGPPRVPQAIEIDIGGDSVMLDMAIAVMPAAVTAAPVASAAPEEGAGVPCQGGPGVAEPDGANAGEEADATWRHKRCFKQVWKIDFPFCYEKDDGRVGCLPCELAKLLAGGLECKRHAIKRHGESGPHLEALTSIVQNNAAAAAEAQALKDSGERFVALQQLALARGHAQKLPQFRLMYQLMQQGSPMVEYEAMKPLFKLLLNEGCPDMHWGDNAGWQVADALAATSEHAVKRKFKAANFISVSLDEGTAVDNTAYTSVHGYIITDWKREPFFLHLGRVVGAPDAANLTQLLRTILREHTGLSDIELARAVVGIGCDGASVLQGKHNGVLAQLKLLHMPWVISSWCFAHRGSLAAAGMKGVLLIVRLTAFVHEVVNYFAYSVKRTEELREAHVAAGTPGNKLISDVPTRWISLYAALRRVVEEWPALLMKVHSDVESGVLAATSIYNQLVDLELFLGAHALLPLLATLDSFLKACQLRYVFINDLSKTVQATIRQSFIAEGSRFQGHVFKSWRQASKVKAGRHLSWMDDKLVYVVNTIPHQMMATAPKTGRAGRPCVISLPVDYDLLVSVRKSVPGSVQQAAELFDNQLIQRFPTSPTMEAMSVVYADYWGDATDALFHVHLDLLIGLFGDAMDLAGSPLAALVDGQLLRQQAPMFFELARVAAAKVERMMRSTADGACEVAATTLMWCELTRGKSSASTISEFVRLAELVLVLVPGSVEEERTFSIMAFIKDQLRNRLGEGHLNTTVSLKMQQLYTIDSFPFEAAIKEWESAAAARGRYGLK